MDNITGRQVKINLNNFSEKTLSNRFKNFLNNNKEKVFTAILDIENEYTCMYVLKEDESNPKWLFYIDDLIVLGEW